MPSLPTLSDLFEHAHCAFRIYHLGRRVMPCSRAHFRAFEEEKMAWESPFKGEARIALVIEDPEGRQDHNRVWCLAFPLDEQGQLQPGPRDAFLGRLLEAGLEASVHSEAESLHDPMKDNPLAYAPDMMARAMLHAWLCHDHQLPLSEAAQDVARYMATPDTSTAPAWETLSLQGLADWAVQLTVDDKTRLALRLPQLDDHVVTALCQCLEHRPFQHDALANALYKRTASHPHLRTLGMRAVIGTHTATATQWLDDVLAQTTDVETLAIISLRGWQHLEHAKRLPLFLDALAAHTDVNFHDSLRDLALIPRLRLPVIMALQQAPATSMLGMRLASMGLR